MEGTCNKRNGCLYDPSKDTDAGKACQTALTEKECGLRNCTYKSVEDDNDSRCVNTCWVDDGKTPSTKDIKCVDAEKKPPCLKCGMFAPNCSACLPLKISDKTILNYAKEQPSSGSAFNSILANDNVSEETISSSALALTSCQPGFGSWDVSSGYGQGNANNGLYYDFLKGKNVFGPGGSKLGSGFPDSIVDNPLN